MSQSVYIYDPTTSDQLSAVRGIGRYLQILKENFTDWIFTKNLAIKQLNNNSVFINPFFNFLQKPLIIKRIAKKQIAVIHDLIPLKYPKKFPAGIRGNLNIFLNKIALKNYDLIVTDSYASKKDIINILNFPENKIFVIYPCLPEIFNNSQKIIEIQNKNTNHKLLTTNYCIYVGDVTWNKNLVNLAKAIKIANITCVFVGKVFQISRKNSADISSYQKSENSSKSKLSDISGFPNSSDDSQTLTNFSGIKHPWQKELAEFIKETKDDKRFIFAGFLPDSELIKLYQQATVNILPSRDEGFGFSYLEAASQGCPSILSDIPVFKEIAKNHALFANSDDPHDLADKIIEIYFNPKLKKQLGEKTKTYVQSFANKKFKKQWKSLI